MIKVIKKDNKPKIYHQECDGCRTELEFEFDDTYIGPFGGRYIRCPECGGEILIEDIDGIDLTSQNIEFPAHFYKMNGVNKTDDEIQEWVRQGLKKFETGKAKNYWFTGTGDSFVIILEFEDEYSVYVMKNYYSVDLPKEERE